MAILNLTPDSFSDGKPGASAQDFLNQAQILIEQGADILDIGGESTRPNALSVSACEEVKRVVSFLEIFRKKYPDFPISLDTKKIEVAKAALPYDISIINDVSFLSDIRLAELARDQGRRYVLMHARGDSQTMTKLTDYPEGLIAGIVSEIGEKLKILDKLNFPTKNLILDIGFGFAKTPEQCVELMQNLEVWCQFDLPLLFAISRKRFLQNYTGENQPHERDTISAELCKLAVRSGFSIIRTHNVDLTLKALSALPSA